MHIAFLADHPEHLPTVASWIYHQWGYRRPGNTVAKLETKFRTHLNWEALPLTLIALSSKVSVGTSSLLFHDMTTHQYLSPWLAAVFVPPEHRNKGIGSRLVRAAEEVAKRLQIERLYLHTPDRESFYARLGWQAMEWVEYRGKKAVIMTRRLTQAG